MRKKHTFAFRSMLAPCDFVVKIQEEAKQAHLPFEKSENAFKLRIDANHGGQVYYHARIFQDLQGGSLIEGEIVTTPFNEAKTRTKTQKTLEVIGCILGGVVLLPGIIVFFLIGGFYELFLRIKNKGKRELPREEKKLLDFMLNKLCCKQK